MSEAEAGVGDGAGRLEQTEAAVWEGWSAASASRAPPWVQGWAMLGAGGGGLTGGLVQPAEAPLEQGTLWGLASELWGEAQSHECSLTGGTFPPV